jgi:hypothetical protein
MALQPGWNNARRPVIALTSASSSRALSKPVMLPKPM